MTLYFHNGGKSFFEILTTLAHYNVSEFHLHIKAEIYFIFHPITYQNIKTQLKKCLFVQERQLFKVIQCVPIYFTLCLHYY